MKAIDDFPEVTLENLDQVCDALQENVLNGKRKCDECSQPIQESRRGVRMWEKDGKQVITCRPCHQYAIGEGIVATLYQQS